MRRKKMLRKRIFNLMGIFSCWRCFFPPAPLRPRRPQPHRRQRHGTSGCDRSTCHRSRNTGSNRSSHPTGQFVWQGYDLDVESSRMTRLPIVAFWMSLKRFSPDVEVEVVEYAPADVYQKLPLALQAGTGAPTFPWWKTVIWPRSWP